MFYLREMSWATATVCLVLFWMESQNREEKDAIYSIWQKKQDGDGKWCHPFWCENRAPIKKWHTHTICEHDDDLLTSADFRGHWESYHCDPNAGNTSQMKLQLQYVDSLAADIQKTAIKKVL